MRNRAHAEFTLHDSHADALKPLDLENPWNSGSYMSLNGTWDFNWYGAVGDVPADWFKSSSGEKEWNQIPVPGTWQTYGFDRLYYLNMHMPFEYDWSNQGKLRPEFEPAGKVKGRPWETFGGELEKAKETGYIPDAAQTVGCYRKWVELSAEQLKERVVLRIGAAESGLQVYVNGVEAGYSQDCFLPAEFEISKHLKPGEKFDCAQAIPLDRWQLF